MTKYEDERLKKRQYKYKIGSVVKFTPRFLNDYWRGRKYTKNDIGIVTGVNVDSYYVDIDVYRKSEILETNKWAIRGREVHLMTYEEAIMEKL